MLPFFAILLFSLIGIGAMVIDGGLALTEQARLETAVEMMVSEWAYVESLPNDALPSECVTPSGRETNCLEANFLAPILRPLGVEIAGSGTEQTWAPTSDTALDGRVVDARGARFGGLEVNGSLDDGSPNDILLERSSPLLFGWATIPARNPPHDRPDFLDVQAARAEQGLAPELGGSGLYGEGFSLSAAAATRPVGVPAMRVGPPIPSVDPAQPSAYQTGGAVGIAWLLSDLRRDPNSSDDPPRLITAIDSPGTESDRFEIDGAILEASDGEVVACLFGGTENGGHLGQVIEPGTGSLNLASNRLRSAYVAVVESCALGSERDSRRILGFLEIGLGIEEASASSPDGSIRVSRSAGLRRNALATPDTANEAEESAQVLRSPARERLEETSAWDPTSPLALRVPTLVSPVQHRLQSQAEAQSEAQTGTNS